MSSMSSGKECQEEKFRLGTGKYSEGAMLATGVSSAVVSHKTSKKLTGVYSLNLLYDKAFSRANTHQTRHANIRPYYSLPKSAQVKH